jgi:ABC-type amino acid transport substrate-binding protein
VPKPKEKVVRLVFPDPFPPFAVSARGNPEGLALEIIHNAFTKVAYRVIFFPEKMTSIKKLLRDGGLDGAAVMGVHAERRKVYDFSDPYLVSGGALFTEAPNPTFSDLGAFAGKTVTTPERGPLAGYIRKHFPQVHLLTVNDYPETLETVLDKKADAAALNLHAGRQLASRLFPDRFSLPERAFVDVPLAIAVLKNQRSALLKKFNEGLRHIKEDGSYSAILKKWSQFSHFLVNQKRTDS